MVRGLYYNFPGFFQNVLDRSACDYNSFRVYQYALRVVIYVVGVGYLYLVLRLNTCEVVFIWGQVRQSFFIASIQACSDCSRAASDIISNPLPLCSL